MKLSLPYFMWSKKGSCLRTAPKMGRENNTPKEKCKRCGKVTKNRLKGDPICRSCEEELGFWADIFRAAADNAQ